LSADGVPLFDESGTGLFRPSQQLEHMRSQLANIIAGRRTQEAADQLRALADRNPDHWQLRELARQLSREAAAQAWQPLGIGDLASSPTTPHFVSSIHALFLQ
jgi:hypothetical protein